MVCPPCRLHQPVRVPRMHLHKMNNRLGLNTCLTGSSNRPELDVLHHSHIWWYLLPGKIERQWLHAQNTHDAQSSTGGGSSHRMAGKNKLLIRVLHRRRMIAQDPFYGKMLSQRWPQCKLICLDALRSKTFWQPSDQWKCSCIKYVGMVHKK